MTPRSFAAHPGTSHSWSASGNRLDDLPPFVWTYPYVRERRDESPDGFILRPVVPLRFVGPDGSQSDRYEALIDSGAENILTPNWVAATIGVELRGETTRIRIGGAIRSTQFHDVDIVIEAPDGTAIRWRTSIGFMDWAEPPWMVILGQSGFFNHFTVCMSRLAQTTAVHHRDHFDLTYGTAG